MLPEKSIREFKETYHKVFHEELNEAEATRRANNLLELYKAIYLPVDSENLTTTQNNESRSTN